MSRRTCHQAARQPVHHDTEKLPCGGFYFAPGEVEVYTPAPSRLRSILGYVALVLFLLAVSFGGGIGLALLGRYGGAW